MEEPDPPRGPALARRLAGRVGLSLRASWLGGALAGLAGFLAQATLALRDAWLAGAVAVGCAVAGLLCLLAGDARARRGGTRPPDLGAMDREAALERSNALQQVGHALAVSALVLAAFAAGSWAAGLL